MRKAFTLAEVLVVIVIIAIVASIMLPVFSRSRAKAKEVICISNLRQIYAAIELYRDDHDGSYPVNSLHLDLESYGLFRLRCPDSHNNPPGDYDLFWWYIQRPGTDDARQFQRYQTCLQMRGSDIPIAWDWNHFRGKSGTPLDDRFEFVLRANGAVNRIPGRVVDAGYSAYKPDQPCAFPELTF